MPAFTDMYNRLIFLMGRGIPIHVVAANNVAYSVEARLLYSCRLLGKCCNM